MKRILIFCFCFLAIASIKAQNYFQQQANFNIAVALNDYDRTLDGVEKIAYTNNSNDTLKYIWFHVWMNAYKNDKTAFSEQMIRNGNTSFYFSNDDERGYTSKLDFEVDDVKAKYEYHPQHIDIIKLILPKPLAPKQTIQIETPFYVHLPKNFSRSGFKGDDYQVTQWYPKPAVYDKNGWHPMPYLENGEFYSEFGNYEVSITVPKNYIVAATGELQNQDELQMLKTIGKTAFDKQPNYNIEDFVEEKTSFFPAKKDKKEIVLNTSKQKIETKTLIFKQDNILDFAWFISDNFLIQYDTLLLGNKTIDCFSYTNKKRKALSSDNIKHIKNSIKNYSNWLGQYPYNIVSVVVGKENKDDGMEYPTITYINTKEKSYNMGAIISHEVGHNWLQGILATNERDHAWMDEGMNSFYDGKRISMSIKASDSNSFNKKLNSKKVETATYDYFETMKDVAKDYSIDTASEAFTSDAYGAYVYSRGSIWMLKLEKLLGADMFNKCMQAYYEKWKFKHPQPQDFKMIIEEVSGKNLNEHFALLKNRKEIFASTNKKQLAGFSLLPTTNVFNKYYAFLSPCVSYNFYDGIRPGVLISNLQKAIPKFQYILNPSYGTTSESFNFFGRASYNIFKRNYWLEMGASYQNYNYNNFRAIDTAGVQEFSKNLSVSRFVPQIKLTLYPKDARSTERKEFGFKTFYIHQQGLNYTSKTINNVFTSKYYVNRLYATKYDTRALYPYEFNFVADQTEDLLRLSVTAKEFFNYGKPKGGINARFFAGKIFYLKQKTSTLQYNNYNYWFNLLGTNGSDDYTFSDYFIGRNEQQRGWKGQQIMERDGFFKTRMDYTAPIGRTDDWLMALNLNADFPNFRILKLYADIGTYAEAWKANDANGRFLYTMGLQVSLFDNGLNIYVPLLMSKPFKEHNDLYLGENKFLKQISFSFNLQNFRLHKLFNDVL